MQGQLPLYLDSAVLGARGKQTARVGEAEVQNLVIVLLQGLHLHAGDGVVEPLELVVPGDGSCNTGAGAGAGGSVTGDRRVSDRPELNVAATESVVHRVQSWLQPATPGALLGPPLPRLQMCWQGFTFPAASPLPQGWVLSICGNAGSDK